ncbi:hypothetical protein FACS1894188_07190 [Clostridia bacterium]|nr:hypothetical protein FACS1894188_07190 [Clostridia bacterium]
MNSLSEYPRADKAKKAKPSNVWRVPFIVLQSVAFCFMIPILMFNSDRWNYDLVRFVVIVIASFGMYAFAYVVGIYAQRFLWWGFEGLQRKF